MKIVVALYALLITVKVMAVNPIAGLIALDYVSRPATDLVYKGEVITAEQAHNLYMLHDGEFDLSELDPDDSSDLWKNIPPQTINENLDELPISYMDEVDYESPVLLLNNEVYSPFKNFKFNVFKTNSWGVPELFSVSAGKTTHNILMRKELLRKLGYVVPAIKFVPKLQVKFESISKKEVFLRQLSEATLAAHERWVVRNKPSETTITIQDVIITNSQSHMYNLASGVMTSDVVAGRRILRSLLVPFALTNIPESVNLFDWSAGKIVSNNAMLDYETREQFDCAYDDAKWVTKRLLNLTRQDFIEVARAGKFPKIVEALVVEKLIARRNSLIKVLKMSGDKMKYDAKITSGEDLVKGKIVKEMFPGYGQRFSYGDPDSPLAPSEVSSFVKSEALSMVISSAMSAINSLPWLSLDSGSLVSKAMEDQASAAFYKSIVDGTTEVAEIGGYVVPTLSGRINLNRKIVAGTFLGTNNRIQLVDVVGAGVTIGGEGGIVGLPFELSVGAGLSYMRNYAHVKPITSVQKALKYPFHNVFVPALKHKYGKAFRDLVSSDLNELDEDVKQKRISDALAMFNENVDVGESILITDNIGISGGIYGGVSYLNIFDATLGIVPSEMIVNRVHIHRASENFIHVYKDLGNLNKIGFSLALKAGVPIMVASVSFGNGNAKSKFFKININRNNENIVDNLTALKHLLQTSSLERIKKVEKPFELKHKIKERGMKLGLLSLRVNDIVTSDKFNLTLPTGEKKTVYRRYDGNTLGNDLLSFGIETLASIPDLFLGGNYVPPSFSTAYNPGNNYFGFAKNRITTYESILDEDGRSTKPFVKLTKIWNGFSGKKKKLLNILKKIKDQYKFKFFPETVLNETERMFLYNINVNFMVHDTGIKNMFAKSEEELKEIFSKYQNKDKRNRKNGKLHASSGFSRFMTQRKKYFKGKEKAKVERVSAAVVNAIEILESKLSFKGISKVVGGDEHFYIYSSIEGFREGDEKGFEESMGIHRPYISDSIGEFGESGLVSPLTRLHRSIGMSEGEFFLSWLLGRVY